MLFSIVFSICCPCRSYFKLEQQFSSVYLYTDIRKTLLVTQATVCLIFCLSDCVLAREAHVLRVLSFKSDQTYIPPLSIKIVTD